MFTNSPGLEIHDLLQNFCLSSLFRAVENLMLMLPCSLTFEGQWVRVLGLTSLFRHMGILSESGTLQFSLWPHFSMGIIPVGIWCQNDAVSTSMRRNHVASRDRR